MREAYAISSLLTILITLFLGSLIYFRGRGGRIVKSYFLLMPFVALWAFGVYNTLNASTAGRALLWAKLFFVSAAFIPIFYFRFVIKLLAAERRYRFLLWLGYFISVCFALSVLGPFMFEGTNLKFDIYWPKAGNLYWLYIVYFLSYPVLAHTIAFANRGEITILAKKQLMYVSIAAVLGFGGGTSTFLPLYGVFIPRLESMAIFLIPSACAFIAVATYTARLMDTELFKRRAVIFSLLYGLSVGIFVSIVFIVQNIVDFRQGLSRFFIPVAALFIITIFIRPIEHILTRWTDKFLYQKKYSYQKVLEDAGKGMLFITNVDRLLKLTVRILSKHMRVTNTAIYLYDKDTGTYRCRTTGREKIEIKGEIKSTNALIEWLKEKKAPLLIDDIINWVQKEAMFPHRIVLKRTLEQLRITMRSLKAALCIPAFIRGQMIGFLVLGNKLSGAGYTRDDIALLGTLSNSAAIAVENARMYEELHNRIKRVADLYKGQHELFIDTATAFSYAVDLRDTYSHQHAQRIIEYCMIIIKGLDKMNAGYSKEPDFLENLKIAALLHDVGRVAIPDSILNKKGPLAHKEREAVKKHVDIAVDVLKPIKELEPVINIIRCHHEFYNGGGYPEGIKGDEIPFASRILAAANAYDAMTSERPYRKAMTHQKAAERLKQGSGKDFDPLIVEGLLVGFEGIGPARSGEIRTPRGEVPPVLY
ncbi:MAG: HD domain-containing protein [Candidatus Omnitrophota bacterium]|nr:MAG: HD domain-containing protein [Candidatus Omnitrophota bacterium]